MLQTKHRDFSETVFILDQGWNELIRECNEMGVTVLLPNRMIGHEFTIQTLIRYGKYSIATSASIWKEMEEAVRTNVYMNERVRVTLFNEKETLIDMRV